MNERFIEKINYLYNNNKIILGCIDKNTLMYLEDVLFENKNLEDCNGYVYFENIKNNSIKYQQAEINFYRNYYDQYTNVELNYSIILLQVLYSYINSQKDNLDNKNKKLNILDKYANYVRNLDAKRYNLDTNIKCGIECNISDMEIFASQTDVITTYGRKIRFKKNKNSEYKYQKGTINNEFIEYCSLYDMDLNIYVKDYSLVKKIVL